ncbi:MAG: hypothetical protein EP343_16285 [Deltaproteobacteria bacterium]|nr:MAG: hypothetical protein EP343_16285 [Deltaproteobacteria bacterium]
MKHQWQTSLADLYIDQEGTGWCVFHEQAEMDGQEEAEELQHALYEVLTYTAVLLTDIRKLRRVSKKARDYFTTHVDNSVQINANAILCDSLLSRTIGNLFLKLEKPDYPIKLFTSMEEALSWLRTYAATK